MSEQTTIEYYNYIMKKGISITINYPYFHNPLHRIDLAHDQINRRFHDYSKGEQDLIRSLFMFTHKI